MTTQTITFTSELRRAEFLRVGIVLALRNPLSLMFLIVAVPLAGVLAGSYAAYRPGSAELFVPVTWEFSEEGVRIRQQGEDAMADWDEFAGWRKVAGCYLLHTAARKYIVLPASGVPAARAGDLEALLSRKAGVIR